MIKKIMIFISLIVFSIFSFAGEIVIGISNAQEGPAKDLGIEYSKGANAYFDKINKSGGINGNTIKVIQTNDGYEPDKCIENTNKLIKEDKVDLLFGYVGTPTAKAVVPIIQKEKIPYFFPFTGAGFLRDTKESSYVFNLRGTYDMETEKMVDYLVKEGKNKIAIFYQDDSYGRAGLSGTVKALKKRGMELVAEGTYERNTEAVNKALINIKKAKPDGVIMIGTYKPSAEFIKRAKKLGMKDVKFLNISFVGSKALESELGVDGEGVIVTQVVPFPWDSSINLVKEYQTALMAYDANSEYGFISLEGYASAKLLVEILKKAGTKDKELIIKAAESIKDYDIGSGDKISYSKDDHQGFDRVFITEIKDMVFISK